MGNKGDIDPNADTIDEDYLNSLKYDTVTAEHGYTVQHM